MARGIKENGATKPVIADKREAILRAGVRVFAAKGFFNSKVADIAREAGYGVIRAFVGHGIGTEMHEEPQVTNYRTGSKGRRIEPGLCLAIEPMFTLGDYRAHILADDWTVSTVDGSLAAHFENSIAITEAGPMILTAP